MAKALKEAKLNTSWIQPNEQWDSAMHDFVAKILDPSPREQISSAFLPVAEEIARLGRDQFARANAAQADVARRARYLPGKRDLGFQPGRSG